ncbi:hypothetical protein PV08_08072 [Exophiala spinifera]|uniref:BZIP domain-containing protein n=1 Tax=Exophiala spinifera TaxID=91928 RepID=A0A0D2B2P4_9EURO|nr:uncharacterized protein PV08_08072 [Exophiala spinifera]KIW12885.1 hypothetical protein PV08_08072 [Exophiala spinifera]
MTDRRKRGRPRIDSKFDNWFGVEDARERKRIQDRLAQRARRSRMVSRQDGNSVTKTETECTGETRLQQPIQHDAGLLNGLDTSPPTQDEEHSNNHESLALVPGSEKKNILSAVTSPLLNDSHRWRCSIDVLSRDHQLLCWQAWPIYWALGRHAEMQGTGCPDGGIKARSPPEYLELPEFLRPTPLQMAMPHVRWIDRFPFPRLRDNMILLDGLIDLDEFVRDLWTMANLVLRPQTQKATWDPACWMMGPEFSSKWGYLFM